MLVVFLQESQVVFPKENIVSSLNIASQILVDKTTNLRSIKKAPKLEAY